MSDDEGQGVAAHEMEQEKQVEQKVESEKTLEANPNFAGAGESEGLEIWRVENFEPIRQDPKTYGTFYNKDAYIVLKTEHMPKSTSYSHNAHFWMGKYASQDVCGTAAILTVELDTLVLGSGAVQHREVQGHESKQFLSYFKKNGVMYMEGGVGSGFRSVDPDAFEKRMFQVKGNKNIRVEQVECKCGSLNQGDTFVLDDGRNLYVWVGPTSENKERLGGVETARRIRDEDRGGKAHIHVIEDDWDTNEEFFAALGSKDKVIKAADTEMDDDLVRRVDQAVLLYRVTEGHGDTWEHGTIEDVTEHPLRQDMLESDVCFILDNGHTGIFVWTGKLCSNEFKQKVWTAVNLFIETRGYPHWVSVTRVIDSGETPLFKQYFETWVDPVLGTTDKPTGPDGSNVAESDYTGASGIDVDELHKNAPKAEDWMPDDGNGEKKVWRVESMELVLVPEKAYGIFFGGDSYVIEYKYEDDRGRQQAVIYFWQGRNSPTESQGAAAGHAVKLSDQYGGNAMQIRVVMFKEPVHFTKMFGGKLVCFADGHIAGYRNFRDHSSYDPKEVYMFQVRGTNQDTSRAVQVDARGASLNANDLFVVATMDKTFVWVGNFSGEAEKEMARHMGSYIAEGVEPTILEEGHESPGFWNALGGHEPYYEGQRVAAETSARIPPRLFQCSNASGRFNVDEIVAFTQEDMDPSDVMLLDTYDELFIWLGDDCNEFEKQESAKTATNYLESDPTGRTPDNTLMIVVRQGFEPPQFTGAFLAWDSNKWAEGKTFDEMMKEVGQENAGISLLEDEVAKYTSFYPLEELQRTVPPEGVDPTKKEMYLTEEDFQEVFGMSKEQYLTFPEWKRVNMRKDHGLF